MTEAGPPFVPSIAARDLIGALSAASAGACSYTATGTAAGEDGSVITSIVVTDAEGIEHHIDVTIGHRVL